MYEHFAQAPDWGWFIVAYFFLAGLAGGAYTLATMLRTWGSARDEGTARIGYLLAFPLVVLCAIFLTVDLGQPLRFWHMLVNTTPGALGPNFYPWSPISLGSWALLAFGAFAFVAFLGALVPRVGGGLRGSGALVFHAIGSLLGLFLASYTGVVLSVSNQPIWSDSYAVGGLFVASALGSSAALLAWLSRYRSGDAVPTERRLTEADAYFAVLELLMIAAFFVTLANAGELARALAPRWLALWILVLASLIPALRGLGWRRVQLAGGGGAVTTTVAARGTVAGALIVLVGVLLLRIVVIFSAQY